METLYRLPMVVRAVIHAAVGFVVAYLACLAWDFDHLYDDYNASRMRGWLVVAALICLLVTVIWSEPIADCTATSARWNRSSHTNARCGPASYRRALTPMCGERRAP
jgi:hypothetical protein